MGGIGGEGEEEEENNNNNQVEFDWPRKWPHKQMGGEREW